MKYNISSWYVYIVGMLRYRELESGVKASHPLIPEYYKKYNISI
jgi:hypothetical protein